MPKNFNDVLTTNTLLITELVQVSYCLKDVVEELGYSSNGRYTKALKDFCISHNISTSHFTSNGKPLKREIRVCLNCGKDFEVHTTSIKGEKQVTCSRDCSNKFFKQATKAEEDLSSYIYLAKNNGLTSCCVCEEKEVVDIHHIDGDRSNNTLQNLLPLCPNHHAYMHRKKSHLIMDKILAYLDAKG